MKRVRQGLLTCCLLAVSTVGLGKDIGGEYAVHGVGANSCADYAAARTTGGGLLLEYEIWLAGYFTAFNNIVSNTYSIMGERPLSVFFEALDEYCEASPDDLFVEALVAVIMVVFPERQNLSPYVDRWPSLLEEVKPARIDNPD